MVGAPAGVVGVKEAGLGTLVLMRLRSPRASKDDARVLDAAAHRLEAELERHDSKPLLEEKLGAHLALRLKARNAAEVAAKTHAVREALEVLETAGRALEKDAASRVQSWVAALEELLEEVRTGALTGDGALKGIKEVLVKGGNLGGLWNAEAGRARAVVEDAKTLWTEVGREDVNLRALKRDMARGLLPSALVRGLGDNALDELLTSTTLLRTPVELEPVSAPLREGPALVLVPTVLVGARDWEAVDALDVTTMTAEELEALVVLAQDDPSARLPELDEVARAF
jgi:hypothetical protein